ncbi:ANR family transcriptional regulator [Haemophilus haemolyticus]|uniref:ANR family transcriptional regulator n=1 Tax=Haemophilus haemolyticus TaxID=726 RepID=UPI0011274D6D|nr:ANR family transcriptional regulator [Haemophilus haemolyticus]TPH11478.1 ANR family transcriptional regulator [Haemophilus haemolyticus]
MKLPFKTNSELAAKEERKKNYLSACALWKKASKLTEKEINKHWCISRAEWCEKMHKEEVKLKTRKIYVPH